MRFFTLIIFLMTFFILPPAYSQDCVTAGHDPPPPPCVGNAGSPCNCGPCGCGGTIQCGGGCSGGDPTPGNYNQPCGSCGRGRITCSGSCSSDYSNCGGAGYYNTGNSCGNCGTQQQYCNGCDWTGAYQCVNQGPCSPGQTQCVSDRHQTCSSSCQWQNSGTNSDSDAKDLQCGDSLCDSSPNVYDSTKTATENACQDSLDNDCDVKTDCSDSDCDGSITGTVKNQDNQSISGADISAKKDLTTVKSAATNPQGSYTISPIACGSYDLVASHPDYAPQTKNNIPVNPQQPTTSNFGGEESGSSLILGTSCEPDCTFAFDETIHASCDGKNGCAFFDSASKAACDNSQPGWLRDYNSTHYIVCASGAPQPKIEIKASVSCASGTLVKITSIVLYNGKPVKLVVAACG